MTLTCAPPLAPAPATAGFAGRTVLVFHAHPDDEAIFTGATMRRLADAGARIVLVTATAGELGEVLTPLRPGESVAGRRAAELEHAAEILGVARLVLLGHRDSGLPGRADNDHPDSLVGADFERLVGRVAALATTENAEAVVHYDADGVYGHPDHVVVHRAGRAAASGLGLTSYESTLDRERLDGLGADAHLVHAAARAAATTYGRPGGEIELAITARPDELTAKRAAILAHRSQVPPDALGPTGFAAAYGTEWYCRVGAPALLDDLAAQVAAGTVG